MGSMSVEASKELGLDIIQGNGRAIVSDEDQDTWKAP